MKVAFGLDLAGYYGGKSGLAKATFDQSTGYTVEIYRRHSFSVRQERPFPLHPQIDAERELLRSLTPLYVDVPLDLQDLPAPSQPWCVWQLVMRPVDFAFGAIPPLADKLGAPVARMRNLLRGDLTRLGLSLYETYPRASLLPLLGFVPKYKRQRATLQDGKWIGDGELKDALAKINAEAENGVTISDDDFDAAICALTGVVDDDWRLVGQDLDKEIRYRLEQKMRSADLDSVPFNGPKGYVLIRKPLSQLPLHIRIEADLANR